MLEKGVNYVDKLTDVKLYRICSTK